MPAATERLEFTPPPQPGLLRGLLLAVIAHVLLMLALTWGVSWKRESDSLSAEAELWSATPQQAAPKLVEAPAPPPPPPAPVVKAPPPPAPVPREADIALERDKKRKAEAQDRAEELERQKKLEAQKKLAEQKRQDELKKQELARKALEDQKKAEAAKAAQAKAQEDAKKAEEARRQENLKRMQGLAGGTGAPSSTGTAQRSSGPSDSYAGRIQARVRPNIVFTDDAPGNPRAEIEVRMAPDGTIIGKRIVKSSGVKSWDDAVLRALDKTEVLPRDVDGRVHTPLVIGFRPNN
jgi:colicin import membrane protein